MLRNVFSNLSFIKGIKYSNQGKGIQNEKTAAAAFAFVVSGEAEFKNYADRYVDIEYSK